ncbi:MAG TPA: tetratricopeptide repeat protein [Candidatus Sulfotelmatobacter sp.]|jgi:Flp pilus assembly protein TadD|nr:tetratricopeptide repeat protein [Candidatus Sulfotelmatobacter sp.]
MAIPPSHLRAIKLFQENRIAEALLAFDDALREGESAELWNDWATAQVAAGRFDEAEKGFGRALELDPKHCQAAVNLGVLLAGSGRLKEAMPLLKGGATGVDEEQQKVVKQLLKECRARCRPPQKEQDHKPRPQPETSRRM